MPAARGMTVRTEGDQPGEGDREEGPAAEVAGSLDAGGTGEAREPPRPARPARPSLAADPEAQAVADRTTREGGRSKNGEAATLFHGEPSGEGEGYAGGHEQPRDERGLQKGHHEVEPRTLDRCQGQKLRDRRQL